ncbi:MAG: metal-dependent transcriptional regulator [Halobacteriovoraceae bacterium]|nr:metal-dependent transcriptional regulator [Halobacteriovoraceae bacterium]
MERYDLSHSMVHYLLTIHKLKEERGFARVTDIARELDITKGSVSIALNNLKKRDLVEEEEDCKFLVLTQRGHNEVHQILSSRTLLFYFLRDFLGVDEKTAIRDSCLMEHLMSPETAEKFFDFMKILQNKHNFNTGLEFGNFKDAKEFVDGQKGDRHLTENVN